MKLNARQLAGLALRYWAPGDAVIAVAVALAESEGDTRALNSTPPDLSYGLWQVNMYGRLGPARRKAWKLRSNEELFDPETNARCAHTIWGDAGGRWTPWSTYKYGRHRKYLAAADAAVKQEMASWRLPPALAKLRSEADDVAPNRSKASDGSIGDASHQARPSDHNIDWDDPQHDINAIDITHDPAHGWDCAKRVWQLVADPRTQYVIWDHGIYTGLHADGPSPGKRRPYKGKNPHTKHLHLSLKHDERVEEDTSPWLPEHKGIFMALSDKEQKELLTLTREVRKAVLETRTNSDGAKVIVEATDLIESKVDELIVRVTRIEERLNG